MPAETVYTPPRWRLTQGKTVYINGVPGVKWPQIQQQLTIGQHITHRPMDPHTSPQFIAAEETVGRTLLKKVGPLEREFGLKYGSLLRHSDEATVAMGRMIGNAKTRTEAVKLASRELGVEIELKGATSWTSQEGWAKTLPKTAKNQEAAMKLAQKRGPIRTSAVEIVRRNVGNGVEYEVFHQKGVKVGCRIRVEPHGDAVAVKVISGEATPQTIGRVLGELKRVLGRLSIRPTVQSSAAPRIKAKPAGGRFGAGGALRGVFRSLAVFQVFSLVLSHGADAKDAKDPAQVRAVAEAVMRGELAVESLYLSPLYGPVKAYLRMYASKPLQT